MHSSRVLVASVRSLICPALFGASAQGRGNELRRHEAHDRHEDDGDDDLDEGEAARVHWTNPVSAKRVSVIPPPKLNV